MRHKLLSPVEHYIVCGRAGFSDVPVGSVHGECFACRHSVIVYPNSQGLMNRHPELHLKIVCTVCYSSAPDKDRIKPMPRDIMEALRADRIGR